ncbi:MAG: hypothetical protein HY261_03950, partial [Chloroflexi bacterium]|nr:hypothetical protein [Chloroflexota bacterium]
MKPSHILSSVAVAGLFFLSGATGLVFEILWARMLGPWIGAGPATNALVIGAFMGGLAAGGLLAGRVRGKPLAAYGCAEVGVGLWGLATPSVMSALGPLFSGAFGLGETHAAACLALKGVATALLVVPPTILMGASFPLLARHARAGAAWLYAMNTAGAVLGSLFGGLILLPAIGASSTRIAASVLDIVIGFLALSLAMAIEPGSGQEEAQRNDGEAVGWQLLATIALWGAATMAGELACERTLALALGSSVYSLTFVVAAFIAG